MGLEDARELAQERTDSNSSAGTTTIRHDSKPVNELKEHMGVSQNKQIAPVCDYAILKVLEEEAEGEEAEELSDRAEEKLQEFEDILEE